MGSVPINEDLYFEVRKRFLDKHKIKNVSKIKITCNEDYVDIIDKYLSIKKPYNYNKN